jgi:hypothetical protein
MGLAAALSAALNDQADELDNCLMSRESGLRDGVYTVRVTAPCSNATSKRLDADLERIGGSYSWYGLPFAWRARALVGRVIGEYWELSTPQEIVQGATVDWWLVVRRDWGTLVLRAVRWFPGEAWLGYRCSEEELVQVASLRPKGIPGFVYWKLLQPVHRSVLQALARYRVARAS